MTQGILTPLKEIPNSVIDNPCPTRKRLLFMLNWKTAAVAAMAVALLPSQRKHDRCDQSNFVVEDYDCEHDNPTFHALSMGFQGHILGTPAHENPCQNEAAAIAMPVWSSILPQQCKPSTAYFIARGSAGEERPLCTNRKELLTAHCSAPLSKSRSM